MSQSETATSTAVPNHYKPLRVWIPMLLLPLMVLARFVPDLIPDGPAGTWMFSAFGPFLISVAGSSAAVHVGLNGCLVLLD
jgi:hypothetical protein